jgi:hypothetical protein
MIIVRFVPVASRRCTIFHYIANLFLPLARFLLMILRPCFVDIRFKNPCLLARLMRLG